MKKKIVLLVLCAVLLLIFASSSYGGFDPNYMEREEADPWQRFTSPSSDGEPLVGVRFVRVTPLELTVAINALANNGYLVTPYILKQVGDIPSELSRKTYLNFNSSHRATIKQALRQTVIASDGTATMLHDLDLDLAGKTGTAQTSGKSHGWFIGFFPFEEPRYTVCVLLEHGGSSYYALGVVHQFLQEIIVEGLL